MIPDMMRIYRLVAKPTLDNLAITQVPVPQPGPGEALIRVRASSLNFHDYLVAAGHIPVAEGRVPMSDGAGEVVALGPDATGVAIGDRVMGAFFPHWLDGPPTWANNADVAGETYDGFAADYVAVPAASLVPMPEGWSFEEAATLPCAGLTAWRALKAEGDVGPGSVVLVPGSGGLAIFAVQLGSALGVRVISTSSSDEKLAQLAALGAQHGINYRTCPDWGMRVRELTQGTGADVVMEIGGEATFEQSVTACRIGGRVLVIGSTGRGAPVLPLRDVIMHHLRVQGMAVGSVALLRELSAFLAGQTIRPVLNRTFAFEELAGAFHYQLSGAHLGKIAIRYD